MLSSFAENGVMLVPIDPEEWSLDAKSFMKEMHTWILSHCQAFPLSEILPQQEHSSSSVFRFRFPETEEECSTNLPFLYPSQLIHYHIGLLHCPSCKDLVQTVEDFRDMYPISRILAFDISPEQQELTSTRNLPSLGLEIFPAPKEDSFLDEDNPVPFYFQFVFKEVAKDICARHQLVVQEAQAMHQAVSQKLVTPSSFSAFSQAYPRTMPLLSEDTFPGDTPQVMGGGLFHRHLKRSGRLNVWIGSHCLLMGQIDQCLQWCLLPLVDDVVWEAVGKEYVQACRFLLQRPEEPIQEDSLLFLRLLLSKTPAGITKQTISELLALQSIRFVFAQRQHLSLESAHTQLKLARRCLPQEAQAMYFFLEAQLWAYFSSSAKHLHFFASILSRFSVAARDSSLTKYEQQLVYEFQVYVLGDFRVCFDLLLLMQHQKDRQLKLIQKLNQCVLPRISYTRCPFVEEISCLPSSPLARFELNEKQPPLLTNQDLQKDAKVFIFSPFGNESNEKKEKTSTQPEEIIWSEHEADSNYFHIALRNVCFFPVSLYFPQLDTSLELNKADSLVLKVPASKLSKVFRVHAFGAQFELELPHPTFLLPHLPKLIRQPPGNVVCNIGNGPAFFENDVDVALLPGETRSEMKLETLLYFNAKKCPRLVRELPPVVPVIVSIAFVHIEFAEFMKFDSVTLCAMISLALPPDSKRLQVLFKDDSEKIVFDGLVDSSTGGKTDVRLPLVNCKNFSLESFSFRVNDNYFGVVWPKPVRTLALSTSPPEWISELKFQVESSQWIINTFFPVSVEWCKPAGESQVTFELEIFSSKVLPVNPNIAAWTGVSKWTDLALKAMGVQTHTAFVAFLEPGEYHVVCSVTSLLKVKWWTKRVLLVVS